MPTIPISTGANRRGAWFHHEATGTPDDTYLVITEIAAPTVVCNDSNTATVQSPPVFGSRDDRSLDSEDD